MPDVTASCQCLHLGEADEDKFTTFGILRSEAISEEVMWTSHVKGEGEQTGEVGGVGVLVCLLVERLPLHQSRLLRYGPSCVLEIFSRWKKRRCSGGGGGGVEGGG